MIRTNFPERSLKLMFTFIFNSNGQQKYCWLSMNASNKAKVDFSKTSVGSYLFLKHYNERNSNEFKTNRIIKNQLNRLQTNTRKNH